MTETERVTPEVAALLPFLRHTNACSFGRFQKRDMNCRCGLEDAILAASDAMKAHSPAPDDEVALARKLEETLQQMAVSASVDGRIWSEHAGAVQQAIARLAALNAPRESEERLREALRPFAEAADIKLCGEWADHEYFGQTDVGFALTFGDLRRAREALAPRPSTQGGVE